MVGVGEPVLHGELPADERQVPLLRPLGPFAVRRADIAALSGGPRTVAAGSGKARTGTRGSNSSTVSVRNRAVGVRGTGQVFLASSRIRQNSGVFETPEVRRLQ